MINKNYINMAIAVDRAKSRLKIKASNLSNLRIDEYSARLASKIKDDATDEEVDEAIKDYDEIINFADVARNDDKIRQLEAKSAPKKEEVKKEEVKVDPDEPAWFKAYREANDAKIAAIESEKTKETITSKFATDERVKNIPEIIRKGFMPTSAEDYETKVEALIAEYTPYAEKLKLGGFNGEDIPATSTGGADAKKGTVKALTAEQTKGIADSI